MAVSRRDLLSPPAGTPAANPFSRTTGIGNRFLETLGGTCAKTGWQAHALRLRPGPWLRSRWYPGTLARRIREINQLRDRMTFVQEDGFDLIGEHKADADAAFYIDPPYTLAARRLYTNWKVDHSRLFSVMRACKGDFLMSYDNTVEVMELAKKHGFEYRAVACPQSSTRRLTNLFVGRNLSRWMVDFGGGKTL